MTLSPMRQTVRLFSAHFTSASSSNHRGVRINHQTLGNGTTSLPLSHRDELIRLRMWKFLIIYFNWLLCILFKYCFITFLCKAALQKSFCKAIKKYCRVRGQQFSDQNTWLGLGNPVRDRGKKTNVCWSAVVQSPHANVLHMWWQQQGGEALCCLTKQPFLSQGR